MSAVMLLASDAPLEEVPLPPGYTLWSDPASGTCDYGFAIYPCRRVLELDTEKRYFAHVAWSFTPERGERIIGYLRDHLENAEEIEFWHILQNTDFGHRIRAVDIPIDELTVEDIRELYELDVWQEPVTDYCFHIRREKR